MLDSYHSLLLWQIQALPESMTSEAIYIPIGALPIEAQIHRRTVSLSLLHAITYLLRSHLIQKVAIQQLARCDPLQCSWFLYTAEIIEIYGFGYQTTSGQPMAKNDIENTHPHSCHRQEEGATDCWCSQNIYTELTTPSQ